MKAHKQPNPNWKFKCWNDVFKPFFYSWCKWYMQINTSGRCLWLCIGFPTVYKTVLPQRHPQSMCHSNLFIGMQPNKLPWHFNPIDYINWQWFLLYNYLGKLWVLFLPSHLQTNADLMAELAKLKDELAKQKKAKKLSPPTATPPGRRVRAPSPASKSVDEEEERQWGRYRVSSDRCWCWVWGWVWGGWAWLRGSQKQ